MKNVLRVLGATSLLLLATHASAQSASTSGISATACSQSSNTLVCTTTTTLTLPPSTNLTGMTLPQSISAGPACASLSASPSVLTPNASTQISLAVNGCPTSSAYTYSWGSPLPTSNSATNSTNATLTPNSPTQIYSVQVCFSNNPAACTTYTASVNVQAAVPTLSGCAVSTTTTSVNVGGSATLTAACSSETGTGSGIRYQWSRNNNTIQGAVGATYTLSGTSDTASAGTSTYSVQISNNAPSSATASADITVTAATAATTDYCPATPVRATFNASEPYRIFYTSDYTSSFPAGSDFVIQLNVAANDTTVNRYLASLEFSDFGSSRGGRYVTVSRNKCDYTSTAQFVSPVYLGANLAVNSGSATSGIGSDNRSADIQLGAAGRWYINIRNVPGGCPGNVSCHALFRWAN